MNSPEEMRGQVEQKVENTPAPEEKKDLPVEEFFEWTAQQESEFAEETITLLDKTSQSIELKPEEIGEIKEAMQLNQRLEEIEKEARRVLQEGFDAVIAAESQIEPDIITEEKNFDKEDFIKNEALYQQAEEHGSRNLGLYKFKDKFVKVVKRRRGFSDEELARLTERVRDLPNVYGPTEVFDLPQKGKDRRQGIVMNNAEGTNGEHLTDEGIDEIPPAHWEAFQNTVERLSERGIQTDLTKRSNFLYDKEKGFLFIDIEKASPVAESTGKFTMQNGKRMYYPYERYKILPIEHTSAKELFTNIRRQEKFDE